MINKLYEACDTSTIGWHGTEEMNWYNPNTYRAAEKLEEYQQEGTGKDMYISHVHGYGSTLTITCSEAGRSFCDFGATFYDLMSRSREYYATPDFEAWFFGHDITETEALELCRNAIEELDMDWEDRYVSTYQAGDYGFDDAVNFILIHHKQDE